ncbi:MAG: hypothetical protein C4293_06140 [Nitrospiraceae bacterium]
MSRANQQGQYYFRIWLSSKKDMYAHSDGAEVIDIPTVRRKKDGQMNFALASCEWAYCYVASTEDDSPIAVEHRGQDRRESNL